MLLDRGLRRRFEPHVEREARGPPSAARGRGGRSAGPARAADLHDRPADRARLRRRDLRRAARGRRGAGVGAHRRRLALRVARLGGRPRGVRRATSVYVPGTVEPMLPEVLSNGACSLVPHQDRLAVTVELEFDGATVRRTAFHRAIIRSDARLDYPQVDRVFAGEEPAPGPWAEPLAAARRVAGGAAGGREARRARGRVRGAGVRFSSEGTSPSWPSERADGVAPADRAPDDRRQRGGRRRCSRLASCRRSTACTSGPSRRASSASPTSSPRSTSRRRRCRTR